MKNVILRGMFKFIFTYLNFGSLLLKKKIKNTRIITILVNIYSCRYFLMINFLQFSVLTYQILIAAMKYHTYFKVLV